MRHTEGSAAREVSRMRDPQLPSRELSPAERIRRWRRGVDEVLAQLRPVCAGCGRPFVRVRPTQVHCSPSCVRPKREPGLFDGEGAA